MDDERTDVSVGKTIAPRRGRPPKIGKQKFHTINVTTTIKHKLDKLRKYDGESYNAILRRLIDGSVAPTSEERVVSMSEKD